MKIDPRTRRKFVMCFCHPVQPDEFVLRRYMLLAALGYVAQGIVTLLTFGQFTFYWGGYWCERNVAYSARKRRKERNLK